MNREILAVISRSVDSHDLRENYSRPLHALPWKLCTVHWERLLSEKREKSLPMTVRRRGFYFIVVHHLKGTLFRC